MRRIDRCGGAESGRRMSGFGNGGNDAKTLTIPEGGLGQHCPQACPGPNEVRETPGGHALGEPLGISEVATLLGCSPWTVRQRYLPKGLPHLRASATGKIVFFRAQVIDWILHHQTKGGWK